ncbi:MAG TPA: hypothetical protein VMU97_01380 [Candidatus Dormibacteraeota bacterium]|nr:hypothetical protein [Candidatus Dormibacteraeota bacterium]
MNRLKSIPELLNTIVRRVGRYRVLIFLLAMVVVYGFIFTRINTLGNAQPSAEAIAAQNNPIKKAHIDKSVIKQLESLRDNNVNVQALFEQARNNPFQE